MASETMLMLIRAIEAYVEKNNDKAHIVMKQDDVVDELFDKGGLAGAEEAGENVDFGFLFSHSWVPLFKMCSDVQLVGNLLH